MKSVLNVSRFLTSVAVPTVLFPIVFYIQYKFGYELAMFPLYLIPIAKITWEFGWKGAVLSVIIATCLWFTASRLSGVSFTHEWVRYYNAGVRGVIFSVFTALIVLFRAQVTRHRERMEAMRALLNVCHGCGAIQGSSGDWIPFDKLLASKPKLTCECPACTELTNRQSRQVSAANGPKAKS